jgi:hypothetical protein
MLKYTFIESKIPAKNSITISITNKAAKNFESRRSSKERYFSNELQSLGQFFLLDNKKIQYIGCNQK